MKSWILGEFVIRTDADPIGRQSQLVSLSAELWATFLGDLMDRSGLKLAQYLTGLLTCSGAVANLIFRLRGKFGHGLT